MNNKTISGAKDTYVVVSDNGYTSCRFMLGKLSANGRFVLEEVHRFENPPVTDAQGYEVWDMHRMFSKICEGLKLISKHTNRINSIAFTGPGAGGAFVDRNGLLIDNRVMTYTDRHMYEWQQQVKTALSSAGLNPYQITANASQFYNASNLLRGFVLQHPTQLNGVKYFPLPSYLGTLLCGENYKHAVCSTRAYGEELAGVSQKYWSTSILNALEIPGTIMPRIVEPGATLGYSNPQLTGVWGFTKRFKVIAAGMHDTACSFLLGSLGLLNENGQLADKKVAFLSSGSWNIIGKLVDQPIISPDASAFSNEGGVGNFRFLRNYWGMLFVEKLRNEWEKQGIDKTNLTWGKLIEATTQAAPFQAIINPLAMNEDDMTEQGLAAYLKKTGQESLIPTTRGGLLRMIYESHALTYSYLIKELNSLTGTSTDLLRIVGGATANKLLNQMAANACGINVEAGPKEATAWGNAILQLKGLGAISSLKQGYEIIKNSEPTTIYTPQNPNDWAKSYTRFLKLVETGKVTD